MASLQLLGPHMLAKTYLKPAARALPADLADLVLLDIADVCSAVRMSPSWIHAAVAVKQFPEPLRFGNRCTRWKSADVRTWLIERAERAAADTDIGKRLSAKAKAASEKAREPAAIEKAKATRRARIAARDGAQA